MLGRVDPDELADRAAISDVVIAYATGLDRRDWELFRSIYTDEIEMDFSSIGIPPGSFDADEWVRDARRLFLGFATTQHSSTNHVHDIRGDEATCVSNMQAEHFVEPGLEDSPPKGSERWTIGGYYRNELVRTANGWRLCGVTLVVTWRSGNPEVSKIAMRRGRQRMSAEKEAEREKDQTAD